MEYTISKTLLDKLAKMINLPKLEINQVPEIFNFNNKTYIPVVSSTTQDKGTIYVTCYELLLIDKYTGDIVPKYNHEHHALVISGERERGYHARLLKSADQKFVMVGPSVDFVSAAEEKQLNFF